MNKITLLNELINDENKINKNLYSSGPYWSYKNSRAIIEIKKKGLNDFRGLTTGIGTSFADNLVLDIRNEFNIKGRIIGKFFSLPLIRKIFEGQLNITNDHINSFLKYLEFKTFFISNTRKFFFVNFLIFFWKFLSIYFLCGTTKIIAS